MPRTARPPANLGPPPPPGPLPESEVPRPAKYRVGPGASHGKVATYACGCRCAWCREAWREYRRPRVAEWSRRKKRERDLIAARALLRAEGEIE